MKPDRELLVCECRYCHTLLQVKGWQPALHPSQSGAFYVECRKPDCPLFQVTATDVGYISITDAYPPYKQ